MITRYEAALNGITLSGISNDIIIHDISYGPPQFRNSTYTSARRQGARIYRRYVEKISVSIVFEIHAYDPRKRHMICDAVRQWAKNGGVLTTNDREGLRLRCICDSFPAITSALKWTEPLTMIFSAYELPFWEQIAPEVLTLTGTSGSGSLFVPGCVDDAFAEVEVTSGGALTTLALTANGRTLTLSGISVASGNKVVISYDDEQIQSIKTGTTSILDKRTGVDDLLLKCGESNALSFTSNVSCTVAFKGRGLFA